jgi:uncharacterized protein DUF6174
MRNRTVPALVTLLVFATACANATSPGGSSAPSSTSPPTDLDAARAAWVSADVGSYALTITTQCFCAPQHYRVVVADDGTVTTPAPENYLPQTVEDLFDQLGTAYRKNAYRVDVTYDGVGVPTKVYIDQSQHMADEEIGYKVVFEDLPPAGS